MARVVIIGVAGEKGLWVADLDKGTVVQLTTHLTGTLKPVVDLRASGAVITKGVDVAVLVKSADKAFSGHLDG